MSETKTMTKERILEIFRNEYKSLLRQCERKVEKYALKMNEIAIYFIRFLYIQLSKVAAWGWREGAAHYRARYPRQITP